MPSHSEMESRRARLRPGGPAARGPAAYLERRRADALALQRAAREQATARARAALAASAAGRCDASDEPADVQQPHHCHDRHRGSGTAAATAAYARALTTPDWMADVPAGLAAEWLATPRPEGVRCLVIAARGRTTIRARSGALLHTVATGLPGGWPGGGAGGPVALDAVLQPDALRSPPPPPRAKAAAAHLPGTLYAVDLLSWGGVDMTAGDAEFRVAWLASKLADEVAAEVRGAGMGGGSQSPSPWPWVPVRGLPTWPADPAGLRAAARWATATTAAGGPRPPPPLPATALPIPDGVLLRHRAAPYAAGAATPLALLWKDGACSRHLIDGADGWDGGGGGGGPPPQVALLRVGACGAGLAGALHLETGDDPPLTLAAAGPDGSAPLAPLPGVSPGALVRATVGPAGFAFDPSDGRPVGVALACVEAAAVGPHGRPRRAPSRADPISKIMFQWGVRTGGAVSLDGLCAAAEAGGGGEGMVV